MRVLRSSPAGCGCLFRVPLVRSVMPTQAPRRYAGQGFRRGNGCLIAVIVRSKKDPGRRRATAGGECRLVAMTGGLSVSGGFTGGSPGSGGSTGGFAGPGGFPGGLSGPGGFTGGSPGPGGSTGGCFGSGGPPGGRCDSRERARNGAWMPARPTRLALRCVPRLQL